MIQYIARRTCYRVAYESKLATTGIKRTLYTGSLCILPTLGHYIVICKAPRATVGRTITTVATSSAACSIATWLALATLIVVS